MARLILRENAQTENPLGHKYAMARLRQKHIFWAATAALLALALLLSLQKKSPIPITNNVEPFNKTNVLKQNVMQSAILILPAGMKTDMPVYNGKELLEKYYILLARNQSVQPKAIEDKEHAPYTDF